MILFGGVIICLCLLCLLTGIIKQKEGRTMDLLFRQFLIMTLSYFLFYYSTPYWSSAQIKDLINHGLYQSLFILLSSVGDLVYKGVEALNSWVDAQLEKTRIFKPGARKAVHGAVNAIVYTVIIWVSTYFYNGASGLVLQGGGSYELSFSEWSRATNAATFLEAVRLRMEETPGFSGVVNAAADLLLYVGVTILYSAFMYGLLRYKIEEFNLGQQIFGGFNTGPQQTDGESFLSQVRGKLIPDLKAGVINALDNLCLFRNFHVIGSLVLFCGVIFLYSLAMMFLNRQPEADGILAGILEASGVVDIVLSFLIAFVWGKIISLLGITVYVASPEPVKDVIDIVDEMGKGLVSTIEDGRRAWAEENDGLFKRTGFKKSRRLDLFGEGK